MNISTNHLLEVGTTKRRNSVFVSFYFLINGNSADDIAEKFESTIKDLPHSETEIPSVFNFYTDSLRPFKEFYYSFFNSPNTHDTFVIQIGLNSNLPVERCWIEMRDKIVSITKEWHDGLDGSTYMGHTVVYKADVSIEQSTDIPDLDIEVRDLVKPLFSEKQLKVLIKDRFKDSLIYLLEINPEIPETVYVVFGNGGYTVLNRSEKWNAIVPEYIYHDNAQLQLTDKIIYKADLLRKQFNTQELNSFIRTLQDSSELYLEQIFSGNKTVTKSMLDELTFNYNQLLKIKNKLGRDSISADQQVANFDQYIYLYSKLNGAESNILNFQKYNIGSTAAHFHYLIRKSDLAIEAMKTTLDFATINEKLNSDNAQKIYQHYLAVFGLILATLQVVDSTATQDLIIFYKLLSTVPNINEIIIGRLLITLSIDAIVIGVYLLFWLIAKLINKRQ